MAGARRRFQKKFAAATSISSSSAKSTVSVVSVSHVSEQATQTCSEMVSLVPFLPVEADPEERQRLLDEIAEKEEFYLQDAVRQQIEQDVFVPFQKALQEKEHQIWLLQGHVERLQALRDRQQAEIATFKRMLFASQQQLHYKNKIAAASKPSYSRPVVPAIPSGKLSL